MAAPAAAEDGRRRCQVSIWLSRDAVWCALLGNGVLNCDAMKQLEAGCLLKGCEYASYNEGHQEKKARVYIILSAGGETIDLIANREGAWRAIYRVDQRAQSKSKLGVDSKPSLGHLAFDTAKKRGYLVGSHQCTRRNHLVITLMAGKEKQMLAAQQWQTPSSLMVAVQNGRFLAGTKSWQRAKPPRRASSCRSRGPRLHGPIRQVRLCSAAPAASNNADNKPSASGPSATSHDTPTWPQPRQNVIPAAQS